MRGGTRRIRHQGLVRAASARWPRECPAATPTTPHRSGVEVFEQRWQSDVHERRVDVDGQDRQAEDGEHPPAAVASVGLRSSSGQAEIWAILGNNRYRIQQPLPSVP